MPLADKIAELRKKQGWSQIELAERLDVSRQSVSKWEMAQAVPELDKILKMSELFSVTTDYLLKDSVPQEGPAPDPESAAAAAPPEPPSVPPAEAASGERPEKSRRPWGPALFLGAAGLAVVLILVFFASRSGPQSSVATAETSPGGNGMTGVAVYDEESEAPAGMSSFVYEEKAVTEGGLDEEALAAAAAEYAPFGITCDKDGRWYFEGQPIRAFTDVLSSNGESLTGGNFQGALRCFAGEGDIDVRTVRDYTQCDEEGCGALLYVETCPADGGEHWTAHHANEHHSEVHHD